MSDFSESNAFEPSKTASGQFFGRLAAIQRCHEHKIRNVTSYSPQKYHQHIERKLRAAYGMTGYDDAREALVSIIRELERIRSSSSKLRVNEHLGVSVLTIAPHDGNVTRWRNSRQKAWWVATALLHSERSFRRIKGYRLMQMLVNAVHEFTEEEQQKAA